MKRTTIEYYKLAVKQAGNAMEGIQRANAAYERECAVAKNAYEGGLLGETGYKDRLKQLACERDEKIESELSYIDKVGEEYSAEMQELGRLDGGMIDDGTMKLLNSGLSLSSADWQELANKHRDNYVMSRILKEHYDANRPKEKGSGLTFVQFGQNPADRQENFEKFIRTLHNSCTYRSMPRNGMMDFASRRDYHNYLAKDSLERMKPFGDESFDTVEQEFPVEYVRANPTVW